MDLKKELENIKMQVKEFLQDIKIGDCFILSTYNGVEMFQLVSKDKFIHILILGFPEEYETNFGYVLTSYKNNKVYPITIDIFNTLKQELSNIRDYITNSIRNSVLEKIRIYC